MPENKCSKKRRNRNKFEGLPLAKYKAIWVIKISNDRNRLQPIEQSKNLTVHVDINKYNK